jgi:DNA-binding SARP family transcriptional activator
MAPPRSTVHIQTAIDPAVEELHRRLIQCLTRAGRNAEAVEALHHGDESGQPTRAALFFGASLEAI